MNGRDSASIEEAQQLNETARHRNVGLVIETRPDAITPARLPISGGWASPKCSSVCKAWTTAFWR